ncbi:hypothetical protein PHLCEN_2v1845 [Hermanssonia centrifuga]|uniref:Uncharacterized protein n=1 Tax=Hermanssonia centrifuga TaxID=98765 RepID=A0A2R6RVQ6_9APHY|nr:hypothetical protein PHLCEN_2v1845 [Hermanssonia centrifuga]
MHNGLHGGPGLGANVTVRFVPSSRPFFGIDHAWKKEMYDSKRVFLRDMVTGQDGDEVWTIKFFNSTDEQALALASTSGSQHILDTVTGHHCPWESVIALSQSPASLFPPDSPAPQ